jgi:sulfur relay protein TusB/DsrH
MTVYLVDEPFVELAVSFAAKDELARLVLLQDAVYASRKPVSPRPVYVLDEDVSRRGLASKIPPTVNVVSFDQLVKMMEEEKVVNFL